MIHGQQNVKNVKNEKINLVGVVGMRADIRTGHLPKTPAQRYPHTILLAIMIKLWSSEGKAVPSHDLL